MTEDMLAPPVVVAGVEPGPAPMAVRAAAAAASVLIIDDDPGTCDLLCEAVRRAGYEVESQSSGEAALERLQAREFDLILSDMQLGAMTGLELCRLAVERRPDVPFIIITAHGSMETAVAAIRAGAYDFISKPLSMDTLIIAVGRAATHRHLNQEVRRLRQVIEVIEDAKRRGPIIGDSLPIRRVYDLIDQVAPSEASVLITGESGTGKELVARAIHARGPREAAPFVAVNCAAVPPTLLESELFGHVRGAFTDAKRDRMGLFVQANGGTLFLDEIGEMPHEMQSKLLRVLQERKVRPVGGDGEVPFDTRLITATNRDLDAEVEKGRFRSDLYYRINVVSIAVPPLRARVRDILPLAQVFLERQAQRAGKAVQGISSGAAQKLIAYDWPGNVRELENCVERAVALTRTSDLTVDDLPEKIRDHRGTRPVLDGDDPKDMLTLAEMERRYVRRVLAAVGGNKTQAAKVLGMDRRSLYRRLDRPDGSTPS